MSRHVSLEFELPDEAFEDLPDEEMRTKAKEAFVMELLREHRLSQGKASELLEIDRQTLFDLMRRYRIPVIDLTPDELQDELSRPFSQS